MVFQINMLGLVLLLMIDLGALKQSHISSMKFVTSFILFLAIPQILCPSDRVQQQLSKSRGRVEKKKESFRSALGLHSTTYSTSTITTTSPSLTSPASISSRRNKQQHFRHCLLFLFDKNNLITGSAASAELRSVYGEEAPKETMYRKWMSRFRNGSKDLNDLDDEERSGRPVEFDEDRLQEVIEEDPRLTIRELAILLNSSLGTIHRHLHAIGKVR